MAKPILTTSSKGLPMHYCIGAIITRDDNYLLIDRVKPPLGFASVAGHVDEEEDHLQALYREVEEESGYRVTSHKLLAEEEVGNPCSKGIDVHYWHMYSAEVEGDIIHNPRETKSIGWYPKSKLEELTLEPVWKYWFEKLGMISRR
jgi:8-oxo-dGTP pyrophosphatase MutT (NUDIX family)